MSWARRYALRAIPYSVTREQTDYGTGTYGGGTYGQEASDPLSNVEYVLVPEPGEWPAAAGWVYRQDDVGAQFRAVVLGLAGPLDLTVVASAALVIEAPLFGERSVRAFPLVIDDVNDELTYEFLAGDLEIQGTYRAAVQLVFDSGRVMSVTPDDSTTLTIRGR